MKNVFLIVFCAAFICMPVLCEAAQNSAPSALSSQLANPFVDCNTLDEAEKKAGFSMVLPKKLPKGYEVTGYRVLMTGEKMIEVMYEYNNQELRFRKGKIEKISGDNVNHPETSTVKINNISVKFSGEKGKIQLAEWDYADYMYSISATAYNKQFVTIGGGISKNEMTAMIKGMLK